MIRVYDGTATSGDIHVLGPGRPCPLPLPRVTKAAEAAWGKYTSTVALGGTPEQRQWAFDSAIRAERKLWAQDRATEKREASERNQAKAKALR